MRQQGVLMADIRVVKLLAVSKISGNELGCILRENAQEVQCATMKDGPAMLLELRYHFFHRPDLLSHNLFRRITYEGNEQISRAFKSLRNILIMFLYGGAPYRSEI